MNTAAALSSLIICAQLPVCSQPEYVQYAAHMSLNIQDYVTVNLNFGFVQNV